MSERDKIIETLKQTSDIWKEEERHGYIVSVDLEKIADALIAAGIGDVKEAEHRTEVTEWAFSKLVHEMYEHGIRPMCDEKFFVESRLKDSEKELAEEKKQ